MLTFFAHEMSFQTKMTTGSAIWNNVDGESNPTEDRKKSEGDESGDASSDKCRTTLDAKSVKQVSKHVASLYTVFQ
jgi:hypothetical protein